MNNLHCTRHESVTATGLQQIVWKDALLDPEVAYHSKAECPLVSLSLYGDKPSVRDGGSLRWDGNVTCITGAMADYDGGEVPVTSALIALEDAGVEARLYTSASHTPENPRWRVVLPFVEPVKAGAIRMRAWRIATIQEAERIIGVTFDKVSSKLSQPFYYGAVRHQPYEAYAVEGECIDVRVDLKEVARIEEELAATPGVAITPRARDIDLDRKLDQANKLLAHIPPSVGRDTWLRVGMALHDGLGDNGADVWDAWSRGCPEKYDQCVMPSIWKSFRKGGGVTWGTLPQLAKEHGADLSAIARGGVDLIISSQGDGGVLDAVAFPDTKEDGRGSVKVLSTIDNLRTLMQSCNISVRYNVIQKTVDVGGIKHIPGEAANAANAVLLSKANLHGLPERAVGNYLSHVAQSGAHNPVVTWLKTLPAGEIPCPVPEYVERCEFTRPEWALTAISRWLIQAVAAAYCDEPRPNPVSRREFGYLLVLIGAQGTGKTSGMRKLLPQHMQEYFASGVTLDISNKDSHKEAVSYWITELGELDATFKKSSIAQLKSFTTNPWDNIRTPYAKAVSRMPRQTVFVASVNAPKFLRDVTGNRRYWPIELTGDIPEMPGELVLRLWQWAQQRYLAGDQWWLTDEEERTHQLVITGHEDNPLLERLLDCYDFASSQRPTCITTSEILDEIGWVGDRGAQTSLGIMLGSKLKVERHNSSRLYAMPPRTPANHFSQ